MVGKGHGGTVWAALRCIPLSASGIDFAGKPQRPEKACVSFLQGIIKKRQTSDPYKTPAD